MSQLGQRLKDARKQMGLSLEELQNVTKIQKRYLQAIEEGNFNILPGQFYARAFVKSYAEAVGLDPEQIFDEYESELPTTKQHEPEIPPRVKRKRTVVTTKKARRVLAVLPSIVAIFFIVMIVIGLWYFFQDRPYDGNDMAREDIQTPVEGGRNDEAFIPDNNVEAEIEEEPQEEVIEEEEVPVQEFVEIDRIGNNETVYELVNAQAFNVKIELQGTSYIGIDNRKGNTFHQANVSNGKTLVYDFSEEETIHFNFGASNNVRLFINDEQFTFPQDIVHQKVTFHYKKTDGIE